MIVNNDSMMPFGTHKGKPMWAVPDGYLIWCYGKQDMMDKRQDLKAYILENKHNLKGLKLRDCDKHADVNDKNMTVKKGKQAKPFTPNHHMPTGSHAEIEC